MSEGPMAKGAGSRAGDTVYEQIIECLSSGVIAVDAAGAIITANHAAAQFLGIPGSELLAGARLLDVAAALPLSELFREIATTREPVTRSEVSVIHPDGTTREIGLSASLLEGGEAFRGVIFLFTDLTERRRMEREAELNRQLAALGELTAGVVHELRSPVSVISGMAELLIRKLGEGDDRSATAEAILRETASLERSIAQFLGFARPYDLDRTWAEPGDIARRALQFCQRRAQRKGTQLGYECENDLPSLYVDANRVAQGLANILVNAVDAVPRSEDDGVEGNVSMRVSKADGEVVFEVSDNGPGIHLKPGENLFTPFFTQKESGTGLGLTIAHRVVAAHGGTISHMNRPEGGTRFEVRLPVEEQP